MCTSTSPLKAAPAERVHYFSRQLITADDMTAEQDYFRQKLRRHNRLLHGWGIVCGCTVRANPQSGAGGAPAKPWQVSVCPGYVITPQGDEIWVGQPVNVDLAGDLRQPQDPCANPTPCPPVAQNPASTATPTTVYLALCYAECQTRPVRVHPVGCSCDETACDYSRIRESFEIRLLSSLPASYNAGQSSPSLCDLINNNQALDCPACPSDPCVVLALITLPALPSDNIADSNINNFFPERVQLFPTGLLQQQVINCCCLRADLAIQQSFEQHKVGDSGQAGLTLTITVKNNGPTSATNVTVVANIPVLAQLPVGEINVTPTSPLQTTPSGLLASLGTLTNGQTVQLKCNFDPIPGGITGLLNPNLESTATVKSPTPDPNLANNTSTAQGQIITL
jgi:hypothetical protein